MIIFARLFSVIVFLVSATSLFGMNGAVPVIDRSSSMPQWEKNKLSELVQQYEGLSSYDPTERLATQSRRNVNVKKLVNDFVDVSCMTKYGSLNRYLVSQLEAMVANPVGRELVYRTMAKITPRRECINSMNDFLNRLSAATTNTEKLNLIGGFACKIAGLPHGASLPIKALIYAFSNHRSHECLDRLQSLHDNPVKAEDVAGISPVLVDVSTIQGNIDKYVSEIERRIKSCVDNANTKIQKLLFDLKFDKAADDGFGVDSRTIAVSGRLPYMSFMSSPLLKDRYGYVGTCTKNIRQEPEEILFHEFSHYFSVVMEGRKIGEICDIDKALYSYGFTRSYLANIGEKWDNTEELRAIVGILVNNGTVCYDYLNESEFNLVAGRENVRISHTGSHLTKAPYRLLEFIESNFGHSLGEVRKRGVRYNGALEGI